MVELPTEKIAPLYDSPRSLVIYSQPKAGKTTVLANLEDSLILDFEESSDMIAARKLSIIGLVQPAETPEQTEARHKAVTKEGRPNAKYYLTEVITRLREGHPYKYLILDTLTALEALCVWDATYTYMNSPVGGKFNKYTDEDFNLSGGKLIAGTYKPRGDWKDITTLPQGYGYRWLRDSYEKWIGYVKPLAPFFIATGHLKLSKMSAGAVNKVKEKTGEEVEISDIDLTGKLKSYTTQTVADSIGYFYRDGNKGFLSFEATDEVRCGSRAAYLAGKHILISEKLEDGTIKTYWENIYKS